MRVRNYDDPGKAIHVAPEEVFAIELKGNPTTGYTWQPDIDTHYAELIDQEYAPKAGPAGAIGAGGLEVFHFRAREAGETQIVFLHRRPWGGAARDTKRFTLIVD